MIDLSKLRAALLIISETASKDPSTDKGIPALQDVFSRLGGNRWAANETRIVPDNVQDIQRTIMQWTDGEHPLNLVVTSGGTGFTQKDVTPEVSTASRLSHSLQPSRRSVFKTLKYGASSSSTHNHCSGLCARKSKL